MKFFILCSTLCLLYFIKNTNSVCIQQSTVEPTVQPTQFLGFPGAYGEACRNNLECENYNGLKCVNSQCDCSEPYPLWSNWDYQCIRCQPGWEFKNSRCIKIYSDNIFSSYFDASSFCVSNNGFLLTFYDDIDVISCATTNFNAQGFYLTAEYQPNRGYFLMPTYYVIKPSSPFWCKDRPQRTIGATDCLVLLPKLDGSGSCLFSDTCDQPYSAICEGDSIISRDGSFSKFRQTYRKQRT